MAESELIVTILQALNKKEGFVMLVVLEGCDGVGKTTLAKALAAILSADIIHCNRYTPNDFPFFKSIIQSSRTKNIIADRFCYGQFVYQKPIERELTDYQLYELETNMLEAGAKIVFVTAPISEIEERLVARSEKTDPTPKEICDGFEQVFHNSMLPILRWNNSGRSIEVPKDNLMTTIFDVGGNKNGI